MIRFAKPADTEALLAIYAQYIETSVTFEYELPSTAEFRGRIEKISREYPYLVWEEDGAVLGYAYAHRFHERAAYQWGAELSVYLDRDIRARGVGRRLYAALMELVALQGVRIVYGLVTRPNERSDRLHAAMGFSVSGVTHSAGFKAGEWHDVTTYEKFIGRFDKPPAPLQSIRKVDPQRIREILRAANENI